MPPDIDTSVVLPPSMTEGGAKADTTCRLKTGHRYNADGVCEWCNAERPVMRAMDGQMYTRSVDPDGFVSYKPMAATIPADLPANKVSPLTNEPFDVDAYLKRLSDREAEELARQHALPTAHHKATIVDGIQKVLLPDGFAKLPLGAERWALFAMVVATVDRWADK